MSTIFIIIPAYEDPLLIETIDGALAQAKHPENLHFAISVIYKEMPPLEKYTNNFKFITYDSDTRPGLNLIRHELLNMYGEEDYILMIDSHTIFAPNWDVDLISDISDLISIHGEKTIISKQVPPYPGPIADRDGNRVALQEKTLWHILNPDADKNFLYKIWAYPAEHPQEIGYYAVDHASGHFFFAPGSFVKEVGIIPVQGHYAQEELLAYSAFMHGWRIYARSDYHHIGHNNHPYNQSLYGKDFLDKDDKPWGIQQDSEETMKELEDLFLYNTGKYQIKTDKKPIDFYRAVSLEKEYSEYLTNQ